MSETPRDRRRLRRTAAALAGILSVAAVTYAATNWVVGLAGGSSGQAQSATVTNVSITAVSSPSVGNILFPGANGDVVVTIANPNPYLVTITDVQLPTNTTYASGFSDNALTTPLAGCSAATPSDVTWNFATGVSGSSHPLTSALTVAANGQPNNPLTVTFTSDATMTAGAPSACANAFFSMPSLTGITATGGAAAATASPATDGWTS
jgi:hypothetical protein